MSFYEHKASVGCTPLECILKEGEIMFVPVSGAVCQVFRVWGGWVGRCRWPVCVHEEGGWLRPAVRACSDRSARSLPPRHAHRSATGGTCASTWTSVWQ